MMQPGPRQNASGLLWCCHPNQFYTCELSQLVSVRKHCQPYMPEQTQHRHEAAWPMPKCIWPALLLSPKLALQLWIFSAGD